MADVICLSELLIDFVPTQTGLQFPAVTRGSQSYHHFNPDSSDDVATFQETAVDATGAGDGFVAGLLQGIVKDPSTIRDE